MSIQYRLTQKSDNINRSPKKGQFAQVITRGTLDTRELCKIISSRCTLTPADLKAAIDAITETIEEKLAEGYNVSLDEMGTFSITAEMLENTSVEDATPTNRNVVFKKVNFRASVRLKKALKNAHFEKI
ncbi:MAG: HU family DNA-binding protein [Bacteroidaceae bacterium]